MPSDRRRTAAGAGQTVPFARVERHLVSAAEARLALHTVRDLLRFATSRLEAGRVHFGHGCDSAFDEAAYLVLWALHLPPDRLDPFLDARVCAAERDTVIELVERRVSERVPLAYLTGEAWLAGVRFRADPRALVPRSPIAELLGEGLDPWVGPREAVRHILDLCTGGASLAILAALAYDAASVTATDLSAAALELARENLADHGLADRVTLLAGDLYQPLGDARFDLILCNPPYVNSGSMAALPPEYCAEPESALTGGPDGMALVRRIVGQASSHLAPQGVLVLEIGHEIEHFEAAFPGLEYAWIPVAAGERMVIALYREQLPQ